MGLINDIPKMIMDSVKNVRWIIPFKKFGMVRVNGPSDSDIRQSTTINDISNINIINLYHADNPPYIFGIVHYNF